MLGGAWQVVNPVKELYNAADSTFSELKKIEIITEQEGAGQYEKSYAFGQMRFFSTHYKGNEQWEVKGDVIDFWKWEGAEYTGGAYIGTIGPHESYGDWEIKVVSRTKDEMTIRFVEITYYPISGTWSEKSGSELTLKRGGK